jgi:hypothetical protein
MSDLPFSQNFDINTLNPNWDTHPLLIKHKDRHYNFIEDEQQIKLKSQEKPHCVGTNLIGKKVEEPLLLLSEDVGHPSATSGLRL